MTTERWNEIYEGFAAALDQKPADRARYLDEAFAHDPDLREEVARLLRDVHEAEQDGFLQGPAWIMDDIPLFLPDFQNGDSKFSTIEYIGHGGMGVVYKAYQVNFDKWVALKLSSPHLTAPTDKERFRSEAQNMARLKHPNIVSIHETGEIHGRPYFVMDLIEGTPLSGRLQEFTENPKEAASMLKSIALAVHHAHQRRVLHNDLKPGNILLDSEEQPHVTDFGLAKRFGENEPPSETGAVEGTASYMSPEQAEGRPELTTASDVYGLGAILYALLTGTPPFRGGTVQETLELVRNTTPKPPRELNPKVDSTLEAICLKCLEKDKAARYASANSVAVDIGRYLDGRETLAQPWTRSDRFRGWLRRNHMEAGLAAAVAAIWIFAVVMALSVAQTRKTELLQATLQSTDFAAQNLATTALLQLRSLISTAETAAADRTFVDLVAKDDRDGLQQYLETICGSRTNLFSNCRVLNEAGIELAEARLVDVPPANDPIGQDFSFRDYFQEPRNSRSPYISGVFRSRTDLLYKFSVAAPILDSEGKFLGIISTALTTDATMGLVILNKPMNDGREVALLAPRAFDDSETGSGTNTGKYVVAFHPAYGRGDEAVEFPDNSKFTRQRNPFGERQLDLPDPSLAISPDDDYRDPIAIVDKSYDGRWIAGFAPVGNTGFVVVVQQRFEDAVSLESSTFWRLALWSALASLVALAILGIVFWRWTRSRRLETD